MIASLTEVGDAEEVKEGIDIFAFDPRHQRLRFFQVPYLIQSSKHQNKSSYCYWFKDSRHHNVDVSVLAEATEIDKIRG